MPSLFARIEESARLPLGSAALGAVLALAGAGAVELLVALDRAPLGPVGLPGIGMLMGAAIGGRYALVAGYGVVVGYVAINGLIPARFPAFFGSPHLVALWAVGLLALALLLAWMRGRLDAAQRAEERIAAREALQQVQERLELALEHAGMASWEADLRSREVRLSDTWARLLGAPEGETVTTVEALMTLVHPEDLEAAVQASMEVAKGEQEQYAIEHRVRRRDGEWIWILSRGRVAERDPASGNALRMSGINMDITARKLAEEALKANEARLAQLAHYDALTGAANRSLFEDRLRSAMARARRGGNRIALLYLDIDKFKAVNDRLGHPAGDALLKEFAARVTQCVRATDTVARLGGDEFALLLEGVIGAAGAERVARKIIDALAEPVRIEREDVPVRTSIGIAVLAHGGTETDEALLRRADGALYEAKSAGRNTYRIAT
jgi:diguanylate cyclase (GGDEF)-like protein/PAS domain S-box-containing protein